MTILTSNKIPVGLRGLSIFLIGMGAVYITAFVSLLMFIFDIQSGKYPAELFPSLEEFLYSPLLKFLAPGVFALTASAALFSQKKYAQHLIIAYGITSLLGFQGIISGHPVFLFAIIGGIVLYYMWQPHVKDYFKQLIF